MFYHYDYVITDTHFGHTNMVKYCNRDPDFNNILVKNWNDTVLPNESVLHLGDFSLSKVPPSAWAAQLNGRITLILGNHDHNSPNRSDSAEAYRLKYGFYNVVPDNGLVVRIDNKPVLFSHLPQEDLKGCAVNIHGHFHNNPNPQQFDSIARNGWYYMNLSKYHLLEIDTTLKPVPIEELIKEARENPKHPSRILE